MREGHTFLAVTVMMDLMLYRGPTQRGDSSECKMVTLLGSDCDGGVSALVGVQR